MIERTFRALLCLALLCLSLGCGDDADDAGDAGPDAMDAGGDGDGDGDRPAPGRRDGSTDPVLDSGSGMAVTPAECREDIVAEASDACLGCLCDGCAEAAVACDEACFRTVRCILERCAGDATDASCIGQRCSQDLGGAGAAMALGLCVNDCAATCTVDLDADGGADDG